MMRYSWAAQVLLFATLERFGLQGLIYLKAALLVLCIALTHGRALLEEGRHGAALGMTLLGGVTFIPYAAARPQLVSFLMAGLMFALLDAARSRARA